MEETRYLETKIVTVIAAIITLVISFSGTYAILRVGAGDLGDAIYNLGKRIFAVEESFYGYHNGGNPYKNGEYGFSFEFPYSWSEVVLIKEDFDMHGQPGVLKTYYWEAKDDQDRFFYLVVGDVRVLREDKEVVDGYIYLGESPSYIYYYKATELTPDCLEGPLASLSQEAKKKCAELSVIQQEEIVHTILHTFTMFK